MTSLSPAVLLPELVLVAGALACLIGGSFLRRTQQWMARIGAVVALAGSMAAAGVALAGPEQVAFGGSYRTDLTTGIVRLAVAGATLLVIWLGSDELAGSDRESETYTLLLLAATGSMILGGTQDLLVLAVGFLITGIPLYGLIGLARDRLSAEATLKTYLIGALAGIVMLLGIVLLAGLTGTSSYSALTDRLPEAPAAVVILGAVAVLVGLLFEAGAVPGHFWVPDATQASSHTAAAFLTTVPKIGAVVAVARVVDVLPAAAHPTVLVGAVAVVTMTWGNLAAYPQTDARRLLGWSTVSQVGYLLVAAALGLTTGGPALLFYLIGYPVTNLAAFAVVAAEPARRTLADHLGMSRTRPVLAGCLLIALLGLVGTPPTAIFVGKLLVASAAAAGGAAWLTVILLVNTLISLFYYLRWLILVFRSAPDDPGTALVRRPWATGAAVVAAAASVVVGLAAGSLLPG
ncbi:NADH-quinone oxidoreductase subunit N [Nakamurella flavida]|uniref:NADH-quinone oxidoreductase subunit N n=1 Tax=Nakamurella flavida TaxID=363630 RepID=A0A938YI35_9ACTN|nr:NADH-quinone oxidoreductase subunit N [Nakamurella flavida]MBM9475143.1 NADH-quinone oxidoreductase subunit N [Nakamurella flavida]MDP9776713.1 NADH-quinone oxidoreductase subunit N [Nakamurella flavida]